MFRVCNGLKYDFQRFIMQPRWRVCERIFYSNLCGDSQRIISSHVDGLMAGDMLHVAHKVSNILQCRTTYHDQHYALNWSTFSFPCPVSRATFSVQQTMPHEPHKKTRLFCLNCCTTKPGAVGSLRVCAFLREAIWPEVWPGERARETGSTCSTCCRRSRTRIVLCC